MQEKRIKIGIVGAGDNTRRKHIPGLRAIPGIEIAGVVNRSPESSRRVADEFEIPKTYVHWEEAVNDPETDAIVIGTWPYLHAPVTLAALEAGKHVLTEARLAMNVTEARCMVKAARACPGQIAQVVPSPFGLREDKTVRRLQSEGFIGEPLAVSVTMGRDFIDRERAYGWRDDADLSGVNAMALGIWYEVVLRWCGHARSVSANARTFVPWRKTGDGEMRSVRVPDHLDVIAELDSGASLNLRMSSGTGFAEPNGITLFGSEGTLALRGGKLLGGQRGDDELSEISIPDNEAGGWRVEEEFVNAMRGLEPVRFTTFDDGLKYMEFTQAVLQSSRAGERIELPFGLSV